MPVRPFIKFYAQDWRGDQTLRMCSLAARGLWLECMCLMHFATPYGHLLVNGKPVTEAQLANLTGTPQDQISALLAELDNSGVSSKTRDGVIYSRRMTRDAKKSAVAKKYGKQGGNPALIDKPTLNPPDNTTLAPRGQRPESIDNLKGSQELVSDLTSHLSKPRGTWTREQKKAAWQTKILNEAQRTMPAEKYEKFVEAWANEVQWAVNLAEQIDKMTKRVA